MLTFAPIASRCRICLSGLQHGGRDCYVGSMPSPAGHVVAGLAVAWAAEALEPLQMRARASGSGPAAAPVLTPLVLACAVLALAPDLDILSASHRTLTHSAGAVAVAAVACGAIARAFGLPGLVFGLTCGLAVASHVALDWLGRDSNTPRGVMALWPVSTAYYYSGIDLFAEVSRRYWKPDEFILKNAVSVVREVLILGPVAAAAFWLRRQRTAGTGGAQRCSAPSESRIPSPGSSSCRTPSRSSGPGVPPPPCASAGDRGGTSGRRGRRGARRGSRGTRRGR